MVKGTKVRSKRDIKRQKSLVITCVYAVLNILIHIDKHIKYLTVSYEIEKKKRGGAKETVFVFTIQKKKVDNQDKDETPIPAHASDIPVKKQQV